MKLLTFNIVCGFSFVLSLSTEPITGCTGGSWFLCDNAAVLRDTLNEHTV
jgi:hypothetical protein